MLEEDATEFAILRKVLPAFLEVAEYYLGDSEKAQAARAKVERRTGLLEPFHGEIYARFWTLDDLINKNPINGNFADSATTEAVRKLLRTLERLTRANNGPWASSYPKLEAIVAKWEEECKSDEYEEVDNDESNLSDDIRLACPKLFLRRELRVNLDGVYNALNRELVASKETNQDDVPLQNISSQQPAVPPVGSPLPTVRIVKEWTQAETAARTINTLYRFLKQQWECECPIPHTGMKVSFTTSKHWTTQELVGSFYFEKEQVHTWRSAEIRLSAQQNDAEQQRLRSSDEASSSSKASNKQLQQLRRVKSLCETLHNARTRVNLVATPSELFQEAPPTPGSRFEDGGCRGNAISISHLVRSLETAEADLKERLILAVLLAYAYLHLSGGPWWPDDRITPDVWFFTTSKEPSPNLRRPYFSAIIETSESSRAAVEIPAFIKGLNKQKPSLLILGKLLMELFVGHPVSWLSNSQGEQSIYDAINESQSTRIGELYVAAVEACIKDVDDALSKGGPFEHNEVSRAAFLSRVVDKLETIVEVRYGSMSVLMESDARLKVRRVLQKDQTWPPKEPSLKSDPINPEISEFKGLSGPGDDVVKAASSVIATSSVMANTCCLHDDNGKEEHLNLDEAKEANDWFEKLNQFLDSVYTKSELRRKREQPVKVAVIDTGAHFDRDTLQLQYDDRIDKFHTWRYPSDGEQGRALPYGGVDEDGHGTHLTSVLLNVAQCCQVYVAQVFTPDLKHGSLVSQEDSREVGRRVAHAVRYAANNWKVDIIVMSFGFENRVDEIDEAIREALAAHHKRGILFFAAASNCGGNDTITWPAYRSEVICVNSATGNGNPYRSTPTAQDEDNNFSTLGSSVKAYCPPAAKRKCGTVHRSGTSTATPVAAGIAAVLIDLMRVKQEWYLAHHWQDTQERNEAREEYKEQLCELKRYAGMRRVLKKISVKRYGYRWIAPWRTLKSKRYAHPTELIGDLLQELRAE